MTAGPVTSLGAWLGDRPWLLVVLAHALVLTQYGWFRDEFYYLACARHLDYGYVDHPALSILPLWLVQRVLGDSLVAMRLLAALALGATTWLVGRLARALGGGAFAATVAMTCAAIAPVYLALGSYYSMNAFETMFWALACWLLLRAMATDTPASWVALGLACGLGVENKISMTWLMGGLGLGLLLVEPRRLLTRGPWLAAACAAALCVPYVVWQVQHDWATLEFMREASQGKMQAQAPLSFLGQQVLNMHPATLPVWLAGLWVLLARPPLRSARLLGIAFVAVTALLLANATSRPSYLAPAFAPLLAAGGCWWETRLRARSPRARQVRLAVLVLLGVVTAPLAMPVLPVELYIRYARLLGQNPGTDEKKDIAELPQFYADRFGWREWTDAVAAVVQALPRADQDAAVIVASNYGEAGALQVLGRDRGLPPVVSGHNNYWLWGPGDRRGDVVVALLPASSRHELERLFTSVEQVGTIDCAYCMPYEDQRPIFVGRGPRAPLAALWPRLKHFD